MQLIVVRKSTNQREANIVVGVAYINNEAPTNSLASKLISYSAIVIRGSIHHRTRISYIRTQAIVLSRCWYQIVSERPRSASTL